MNQIRLATFLIFLPLQIAFAQQHYPKNFAGSTYNESLQDVKKKPTQVQRSDSDAEDSEEERPEKSVKNTSPLKVSETTKADVPVEENGVEVVKIGGYLDARDAKGFEANINDLKDVASKYDLAIGDLYGVGNYGWLFNRPDIVFMITARNGNPRIAHSVPKELNISSSPAWLVTTKHGTIILEGTGKLDDLFNPDGKLVLSRLSVTKDEKPTSTSQPEPASSAAQ